MKLFGNTKKKDTVKVQEKPSQKNENANKSESPDNGTKVISAIKDPPTESEQQTPKQSSKSPKKSSEERRKIDEMITDYQKKKIIRRLIILAVLLIAVVVTTGFIFVKSTIKPPDVSVQAPTTFKPEVTASAIPSASSPLKTPAPSATPSPTPTSNANGRKPDFYTFVIVGEDDGNGNTDTMIVGALDNKNKELTLVNIPRDTLVNVSWPYKKANTLLHYAGEGVDGLKNGIRDLTGFTVDSYLVVDLDAFIAIVNTMGGVYFDVPINMYYDDPVQELHINLSAGYQWLNGEQAMGVVRFRQNNDGSGYAGADIERISTQQDFMKAVADQLLSLGNVTKINELAEIFEKYVDTNLSAGNIIWYGMQMLSLKQEDIHFYTLPAFYNDSVRGGSYCTILLDEWIDLINSNLSPYSETITENHLNILTRDEDGYLYSTTGTIAGGYDSFFDFDSYLASFEESDIPDNINELEQNTQDSESSDSTEDDPGMENTSEDEPENNTESDTENNIETETESAPEDDNSTLPDDNINDSETSVPESIDDTNDIPEPSAEEEVTSSDSESTNTLEEPDEEISE